MRAVSRRDDESGMALITVFMVLMLASALMVGFFATIAADQRANGIDRDQTQAYAAAHAGLEKLTSAMATLFVTDYSPSKVQIDAIVAQPPVIPGFAYTAPGGAVGSGYAVTYNASTVPGPNFGNPVPDTATGTADHGGTVCRLQGHHHEIPDHGHRAVDRRRRSAPAPRAADGGGAGVPVRRVLRDRPDLLRRRRTSTSADASRPTATCFSPRSRARR